MQQVSNLSQLNLKLLVKTLRLLNQFGLIIFKLLIPLNKFLTIFLTLHLNTNLLLSTIDLFIQLIQLKVLSPPTFVQINNHINSVDLNLVLKSLSLQLFDLLRIISFVFSKQIYVNAHL